MYCWVIVFMMTAAVGKVTKTLLAKAEAQVYHASNKILYIVRHVYDITNIRVIRCRETMWKVFFLVPHHLQMFCSMSTHCRVPQMADTPSHTLEWIFFQQQTLYESLFRISFNLRCDIFFNNYLFFVYTLKLT